MVKLIWNVLGWIYQDGIRNLRETFAAASIGIDQTIQGAYRAVDEYDAGVKAGADPQIEVDDNGIVVQDYRDILIYQTTTAEETKSALNKALAITMFHHWERAARGWTNRPQGKFTTLCEHVVAKGYPIHSKLEDIHLLVNLLKHANSKHGLPLYAKRPDFFRDEFSPSTGRVDWYDEVNLNDQHITEFFDIVATSGPTASPPKFRTSDA